MSNFLSQFSFNLASQKDVSYIWSIIEGAILRRKKDGSSQWQDGYPNKETIEKDIENLHGYVLKYGTEICAYGALIPEAEPAYEQIDGKWLSSGTYLVIHRVAVSEKYLGQGLAKMLFALAENFALNNKIYSIRVDTNFDNLPMLTILTKLGYQYCGEVYFREQPRKAFEKIL